MFYALANDPDFWDSKMNFFVALAPITQLKNTENEFIKYMAKNIDFLLKATNFAKQYSILGPMASTSTKCICQISLRLCNLMERFLFNHNPKYDNIERF